MGDSDQRLAIDLLFIVRSGCNDDPRLGQRLDQPRGGVVGNGHRSRYDAHRQSAAAGGRGSLIVNRHREATQQPRQGIELRIAQFGQCVFRGLVDRAVETLHGVVGGEGETSLDSRRSMVGRFDLDDLETLEQLFECEFQQRQGVLALGIEQDALVEPLAGLLVRFVDEAGRRRRFMDDFGEFGLARRREIVDPTDVLQREEVARRDQAGIDVGPDRRHRPDPPARAQREQQPGERRALLVGDIGREDIFELVDQQQQVGAQPPAGPAPDHFAGLNLREGRKDRGGRGRPFPRAGFAALGQEFAKRLHRPAAVCEFRQRRAEPARLIVSYQQRVGEREERVRVVADANDRHAPQAGRRHHARRGQSGRQPRPHQR